MNIELLKELCDVQGVAGYEEQVQSIAIRELGSCCDEVYEDRMGNVVGVRKPTTSNTDAPPVRLMICAHSDECGFMVREVTSEGYIRLRGIAGPNPMASAGQQVRIEGTETVFGIMVPTNPQAKQVPGIEEMLVDTGCDADWVKERVRVGDRATWNHGLSFLNNDIITARNFDDRLGLFCMLEGIKNVKSSQVEVYAVSSVQEELGTRGAQVASNVIRPDIGIAIDGGCVTSPMYGPKDGWTSKVGDGVAIYQADGRTVSSKSLNTFIESLAEANNIPYHDNWHGGTDANQMQKQGKGALATTIGVPSAYMHWANGLADLRDVKAVIDLITQVAENAHELGLTSDPWVRQNI